MTEELLTFLPKDGEKPTLLPLKLDSTDTRTSKYGPLARSPSVREMPYRVSDARIVTKRGRVKTNFTKIPQKSLLFSRDLWNTLANMQWRWLILTVVSVNVLAYTGCALLFYYDAWISGDFNNDSGHNVCIQGAHSYRSFFMLSIETLSSTGYGYLHPTEHCRLFFVIFPFSTIATIFIDGAFVSVVYAKLNKTKNRNISEQIFSTNAVITLRNGKLCLKIRVNDREGKHWINSDVRLYMAKEMTTQEGVVIPNYVTELDIAPFGTLFWPVDIVHEIGPSSPLWTLSAQDLVITRLEIVIVVLGSSVKTGQLTRSQTSYLNKEIIWGSQFSPCLEYNNEKSEYVVNKRLFHHTISQEVPLCSAKILNNLQENIKIQRELKNLNSENSRLENVSDVKEV